MLKILIIQTAFIGDVILATPLIETLRLQFPNSKIDFLVKNGNQNLLINHPNLNRVLVFDKSKKIFTQENNSTNFQENKRVENV